MGIRVCLAGATGWAGAPLARAIFAAPDMQLVGALSKSAGERVLGSIIDQPENNLLVSATIAAALQSQPDVFIEYTKPDVAKTHILQALHHGCHVLVGTSGLSDDDYAEIDLLARSVKKGVLACGNFSLTAVLFEKFAEMAARHIPYWEIIDYASSSKVDSPSGTTRELVHRLEKIGESKLDIAPDEVLGPEGIRGSRINGTQVHAVRLPGYILSIEALFGLPDQKLTIKHEAGSSAQPYVDGALLGVRKVTELVGLHRGLAEVMDF